MTRRPVLLLRGSCQLEKMGLMLRALPQVNQAYDIHVSASYARRNGDSVDPPPADVIAACKIFLYQVAPFKPPPPFAEELIARVRSIRVPFASGDVFWPSEAQCGHDPRYPELPGGRYPFGDLILGRLLRTDADDESVVDQYLQLDFAELFRLDEAIEKWYRFLEKLEAETVIDVSGFVRRNWRTRRLFWDSLHPANCLIARIAGELTSMLGTPVNEHEIEAAQKVVEDNFIMKPIHPSLIRYFGLTWAHGNDLYSHLDDPPVTSREWYLRYVAYMRELYTILPEVLEEETTSVQFWKRFTINPA
jgi:hypothetical protein